MAAANPQRVSQPQQQQLSRPERLCHVNRLLKEYNLSLLDVNEKRPETVFEIRESGAISYKDSFGNYWKRDLLRVLCEYNYCRMLRYRGTTDMLIVGTQENIAAVTVLYDYLRTAFRRLADKRHMEYVSIKRGYFLHCLSIFVP